ncbi:MAG: hypothetical protein ACI8ZB_003167 [Desulforhopalus sp.]|jgi:hypothetical protein
MRSTTLTIHIFLICLLSASVCHAKDRTHHAYKVTSYNLGAILDFHKKSSLFETGNFNPLMITSTTSDILNSELQPSVSWVETISHNSSSKGIAFSAQYEATDKISFQGAFGITRNLWTPDNVEYENESSWEANLGFIYKLVNNLSYELHFGYMDTGALFNNQSSYSDVENIIMVSNQLSMSF